MTGALQPESSMNEAPILSREQHNETPLERAPSRVHMHVENAPEKKSAFALQFFG